MRWAAAGKCPAGLRRGIYFICARATLCRDVRARASPGPATARSFVRCVARARVAEMRAALFFGGLVGLTLCAPEDGAESTQLTGAESADDLRKVEFKRYLLRLDRWHAEREAYARSVAARREQFYDEYFERMKSYGKTLQQQNYMRLLQKQAQERAQLAEQLKYWRAEDVLQTAPELPETRPSDPFSSSAPAEQKSLSSAPSTTNTQPVPPLEEALRPLPSAVTPRTGMEASHRQAVALESLCQRFLPTVRMHCNGDKIEKKYQEKCQGYFQDCQQYIRNADPLYSVAHSFDSGVGLNLGWAVKGIPFYPINEEGAIGAGYQANVPFGAWGGGYSQNIGVRDYWSQYQEVGANWYDGKYGYRSGWSVPLVQSLGIEGENHATVSVPIKPGELGKPIGVDVGGGVGPYYGQNTHVGVDYLNGQVNTGFGVAVPFAGVGVNTGVGVKFPSIADITG